METVGAGPTRTAGAPDSTGRLEARVRGRVQGVGFRDFVQSEATLLGLAGYVRNASGGRAVEVVAEGPRSDLERLLAALRRGPPMAYVEGVDASWGPAGGEFAGFAVRH
jgi:acylphosphatase